MIGEGKYNINSIREIKVTKSYLGLSQAVRGCQDGEPILDCTTRLYIDTALNLCGCLPLNMRTDMNVSTVNEDKSLILINLHFSSLCVQKKSLSVFRESP